MVTNEKVVSNFNVIKNHYNIFPLAAIFGTPPYGAPPDLEVPNMAASGKMS